MTELVSVGMALPIEYTSASTEKFSNLISTSGNVIPTLFLKHSDSTQPKNQDFHHTRDIFISRYLSILSLSLSMRSSLSWSGVRMSLSRSCCRAWRLMFLTSTWSWKMCPLLVCSSKSREIVSLSYVGSFSSAAHLRSSSSSSLLLLLFTGLTKMLSFLWNIRMLDDRRLATLQLSDSDSLMELTMVALAIVAGFWGDSFENFLISVLGWNDWMLLAMKERVWELLGVLGWKDWKNV